jgi:uncharacterized protein with HEPN domain
MKHEVFALGYDTIDALIVWRAIEEGVDTVIEDAAALPSTATD